MINAPSIDDIGRIDRLKNSKLLAEAAFARAVNLDLHARVEHRTQMLLERFMKNRIAFTRGKYLHPYAHVLSP